MGGPRGVNAAVVGCCWQPLVHPICTGVVRTSADSGLSLVAVPPWLVVILGALAGWGMAFAA